MTDTTTETIEAALSPENMAKEINDAFEKATPAGQAKIKLFASIGIAMNSKDTTTKQKSEFLNAAINLYQAETILATVGQLTEGLVLGLSIETGLLTFIRRFSARAKEQTEKLMVLVDAFETKSDDKPAA